MTVRHQNLKDNQEMQNSVKKISSTISQAKNYIMRQGIKCQPETQDNVDILSEEKDVFIQMP